MADRFIERSKETANNFIQDIVPIDDKAYKEDSTNNALSALDVSNTFAKTGKICAMYASKSVSDIDSHNVILEKADVVILDWYLGIERDAEQQSEPDADADNDGPRREFTLKLLKQFTSDAGTDKLELIIVYTGETGISDIKDIIIKNIDSESLKDDDYTIKSSGACIIIRAKAGKKFEHISEYKPLIVEHDKLPELVLTGFTSLTNGLLSDFVLSPIITIRNNTSKMLGDFSPKLDPAYLGCRVNLPNPNDAKELLVQLFGDAIVELIGSENVDTNTWVENWIHDRIEEKTIILAGKDLTVNPKILYQIINAILPDLNTKINSATKISIGKKAPKLAPQLFQYGDIQIEDSDISFAKLTHHKNIFLPQQKRPMLALGTIIKNIRSNLYHICMQQRCDSVRVQRERRFLLLPLEQSEEHYSTVVSEESKSRINESSYALRTIEFSTNNDEQAIYAVRNDNGKCLFTSIHQEPYEWVVDLKEVYAQRIVNSYYAQLSHVGLNESEWLRLQAK